MGPLGAQEDLKFYTMTVGEQFVILISICMTWCAESWAVGQCDKPQTQTMLVKELEKYSCIQWPAQEEKA